MALFSSSGSGNWNNAATWGGAGVPGAGDTVSIGAHTITVSDTRIIGTSPNNNTTKVIDMTSASSVLIVNAALTIRGNLGMVNDSTLTLGPGGSILWDASAAGGGAGLPIYNIINAGFCKLNVNGTSSARCAMFAPSSFTFSLNQNYVVLQVAYCDFTRLAAGLFMVNNASASFDHCVFTNCGLQELASTASGLNYLFNFNRFDGSGADCFKLSLETTPTAGTRELIGNSFDTAFTYFSMGVVGRSNYFGGGIDGVGTKVWKELRGNLVLGTRADGQRIEGLIERNYFTANGTGNPHFIEVRTNSSDTIFSQNIFESHEPDLVDFGDCIIAVENRFTPPFKCIGKNNIVLRGSNSSCGSGTLLTLYNAGADVVTEWLRNTANVDNPSAQSNILARRSPFSVGEAANGSAGNVSILKSNLVWGTSPGQGYVAERLHSNVIDLITASGVDYNWTSNLSGGNQERSYQDWFNGAFIWSAGNAVAAGVDVHQGTGDPQFYDRNRNLALWAADRGHGSTYEDALSAVRSDPSRVVDLISYVFEGFRCGNPATRNAAHDGGCVGAANFHKSDRTFAEIDTHRATLSRFGL